MRIMTRRVILSILGCVFIVCGALLAAHAILTGPHGFPNQPLGGWGDVAVVCMCGLCAVGCGVWIIYTERRRPSL
jgi:hypothetical protein